MIGETVGSYRITAKVSVGGMGSVYRAEHVLIGKVAAVKVLHEEFSSNKDIVQRFFNEAKATTAIKHKGIVEVFDYGHMASGHAYLVMEFLDGMSLAKRIKTRGRMSEGDAAMLLRPICSALQAAHDKGIVHRDLKPDNIFIVPDADAPMGMRPKVLDFGIAKLTDIGLATSATKTGAVMGTPTYMSPEQCKGTGEVDHRADLYSLGCIFYELITGRPPFTNRGAGELIGAHLYVTPERPSKHNAAISPAGESLALSLLEKDPAARPQTAKDLGSRFAKLAEMMGWGTGQVTSPELAHLDSPDDVPTTADVDPTANPPPEDYSVVITPAEKPTTLSGAASQSVVSVASMPAAPRRSRGWLAGIVAAVVVVGVGTGVAVTRGAGGSTAGTSNAGPSKPAAKPEVAPAAPDMPRAAPDMPPAAPDMPARAPKSAESKPAEPTATISQPSAGVSEPPAPAPVAPAAATISPPAAISPPTPAPAAISAKPKPAVSKPKPTPKPVAKPEAKPDKPVEPPKPALIETDI